ncbi:putative reverse transcriptase domain-containing protein [Tanacetum coccineum]
MRGSKSYRTSKSCGAKKFFRTERAVGLLSWLEGMEYVLYISKCPAESQVEFASEQGKANLVADALSIKEWMKPRRTRAMSMKIHSNIKDRILEAQSEASKNINTSTEMLQALDKQSERKDDGGLYFVERIWVPVYGNLRTLIMNKAHTIKYFVHPRADKMYYDLRDLYWWLGIKKDIALYVSMCLTCSKVKAEHQKPSRLLQQPEIPEWKCYFTSRFWKSLQKALGTQLDLSTAYHPKTDGQTLYGRKCRTPIAWAEVGESKIVGPEIIQETTDKIVQIKERLKTARDRQKSYADHRRKPLEFSVGDKVLLKVSPWNGVVRFGNRSKLLPRYVGLFAVVERVGHVAYRLRLPHELIGIHDTFHVSNLKKYLADVNLHIPLEEIRIDDKLRFVEEPIEIMDHEVKKLKRSWIPIVKVRWNSRRGPEFTWEREDKMKRKSGGGLAHLGGKSSRVFKYECGEVDGVVNTSSRGARVVGAFGCRVSKGVAIGDVSGDTCGVARLVVMRLFIGSLSGDDSLDEMSMIQVRATFLGKFLLEDAGLVEGFVILTKGLGVCVLQAEICRIEIEMKKMRRKLVEEAFSRQPRTFLPIPWGEVDGIRVYAFWERGDRPINRVHARSFAWNTKNFGKLVKRKEDFLIFDDKGNRDCLITIIKVNGRENFGNVGVTNEGRVNDSTFMKEAFFKVFENGSFITRETRGAMMHGDVVDGVLVIFLDCAWHFQPKKGYFNKENSENVKCQDEEQISMRELEYRIEKHYERDDDDDYDVAKYF